MLKIKEIRPLHNMVVTTMDLYDEEEIKVGGIIDSTKIKNPVKEYQKVIAVGPMVRNIEVGDVVMINPARYTRKMYEENTIKKDIQGYDIVLGVEFPTMTINDKECLLIYDNDIQFVITKYEEQKEEKKKTNTAKIHIPEKRLIL